MTAVCTSSHRRQEGRLFLGIGPFHHQRLPPGHHFYCDRFIGAVILGKIRRKGHFGQRLTDLSPERVGDAISPAGCETNCPVRP